MVEAEKPASPQLPLVALKADEAACCSISSGTPSTSAGRTPANSFDSTESSPCSAADFGRKLLFAALAAAASGVALSEAEGAIEAIDVKMAAAGPIVEANRMEEPKLVQKDNDAADETVAAAAPKVAADTEAKDAVEAIDVKIAAASPIVEASKEANLVQKDNEVADETTAAAAPKAAADTEASSIVEDAETVQKDDGVAIEKKVLVPRLRRASAPEAPIVSARGRSSLALATRRDADGCKADAEQFQLEVSSTANKANKAYLERLSKAAAEAAEKGYGIQRSTHIIRRTRIKRTTTKTDLRTQDVESKTENSCKVESWTEEGSPSLTGVGVLMTRQKRSVDTYSDGTEDVQDHGMKGRAMFWLDGGDKSAPTHYDFDSHRARRHTTHCGTTPRLQYAIAGTS